MIYAAHAPWAQFVFDIYIMRLFKKHFHSFHLYGEKPAPDPALPLLLLPNHSTWWDGFFIHLLNRQIFRRKPYLMMLERQLKKYAFFRKLGVYSVNPGQPKDVLKSLEYTIRILQTEKKPSLVCIFPQGELLPWHTRPLRFRNGASWVLKKHGGPISVLPLAIRCEYRQEQLPEVSFQFGNLQLYDHTMDIGKIALEAQMVSLLDELSNNMLEAAPSIDLVNGRTSLHKRVDKLAGNA